MNRKHPVTQMERKSELAQVRPDRHTSLRAAAEKLSLRNADQAVVELLMEAVQRLTLLVYEEDEGGGYCNADGVTGKLLIPAPWGRNGYARWGLRPSEGVILREMMQQRQKTLRADGAPGLFNYDSMRRSWLVNFYDYDTLRDAQLYWQSWPLTIREFRAARQGRGY